MIRGRPRVKKDATGLRQKVRFWLRMLVQVRRPQDGQVPASALAAAPRLLRTVPIPVVPGEP